METEIYYPQVRESFPEREEPHRTSWGNIFKYYILNIREETTDLIISINLLL